MNNSLPAGAPKRSSSPELQEKTKTKKQELKSLKRDLKAATAGKREEIEAKIKALKKDLKVIAPRGKTW